MDKALSLRSFNSIPATSLSNTVEYNTLIFEVTIDSEIGAKQVNKTLETEKVGLTGVMDKSDMKKHRIISHLQV